MRLLERLFRRAGPSAAWLFAAASCAGLGCAVDVAPESLSADAPHEDVATAGAALSGAATFTPAASMAVPRREHADALLKNGEVLIVGGGDANNVTLASAEIYDPKHDAWRPAAPMSDGRNGHTATALAGGDVLVVGGSAFVDAEVYDPSSNTWALTGPMAGPGRQGHTATRLEGHGVLVVGGPHSGALMAELYDSSTNAWSSVAPAPGSTARALHTATRLHDGRVLVAGGFDATASSGLSSAALYDPSTGTWATAAPLSAPRQSHEAVLLADGRVLVTGGSSLGLIEASAELYDPEANTWTPAASMQRSRTSHTVTLLKTGKVLVVGTIFDPQEAELYDPNNDAFELLAFPGVPRSGHTATRLKDGRVLLAGGQAGEQNAVASTEIYGPRRHGGASCPAPMEHYDSLASFSAKGGIKRTIKFDDVVSGTALGNPARLGSASVQHSSASTFKTLGSPAYVPLSSPNVLAPFEPDNALSFGETTLTFRTTRPKSLAAGFFLILASGSNQDAIWTSTVTATDVVNNTDTEEVTFRGQVGEQQFIGFKSRWPLASISFSPALRADGQASSVVAMDNVVLK